MIEYEITLDEMDIDFTMTFRESTPGSEETVVTPKLRVMFTGYSGKYTAETAGELKFVFSNYFSWMSSKTVNFSFTRAAV